MTTRVPTRILFEPDLGPADWWALRIVCPALGGDPAPPGPPAGTLEIALASRLERLRMTGDPRIDEPRWRDPAAWRLYAARNAAGERVWVATSPV